jgi:hypothetical protein
VRLFLNKLFRISASGASNLPLAAQNFLEASFNRQRSQNIP